MMSLAWPLFRVTEQAALAAWPQTGCGDKNKIDGLAVTAMRQALNDVAFRGRVVIGEGEIDHAPMLWIGVIIYISCRIVFICKGFRIFFNNLVSLLYFILYLCSVEIVPVILSFTGAIFLCRVLQS